jgi:hypothetical protein
MAPADGAHNITKTDGAHSINCSQSKDSIRVKHASLELKHINVLYKYILKLREVNVHYSRYINGV